MKVFVTLDYWDGARSKSRTVDLDSLDTTFLKLTLRERGVAGLTITKLDKLEKLAQAAEQNNDEH